MVENILSHCSELSKAFELAKGLVASKLYKKPLYSFQTYSPTQQTEKLLNSCKTL